jgi:Putative GTPase activating protein for Arf
MSAAAEAAVKRLARAPGNTTCPNCGLVKKFGFGTVCMKFLTFVCNECKSSHQAISHRCKSLTMSAWTDDEVAQLERVGGNDMARATWLATAPPPGQQGRPSADGTSSIDTYKAFIVNVYERKLYYRERSNNDNGATNHATRTAAAPASTPAALIAATTTTAPPPRRAVVVVADLLDFGAPVPALAVAAPSQSATAGGMDLFGDFGSATTTTTTTASISGAPAAAVFDPFGTASAATSTNQASSTFSAFPTAATSSAPTPVSSFDPLGHLGGVKSSQTKPPVMNNLSNSSAAGIGNWMAAAPMNNVGTMNGMHNGMGMNSMMNANAGTNPMMMNSFGQMPGGMQPHMMAQMTPNRMTMPMQMQQQPQQQQFMMGGATAFHNNPMSAGMMNQNGFSHSAPVMNQHVNNGVWNNNTSLNSSMGIHSNTISSNFGSQPNKSSSTQHDPFANLGL